MRLLLYRLARGWLPPYTPSLKVVALRSGALRSGDRYVDVLASMIRLDGDRLLLECQLPGDDPATSDVLRGELSHPSLSGRCEEGTIFSMRDAVATWTTDETLTSLVKRVVIAARDWSLRSASTRARLWVGLLDAELPRVPGNLSFTVGDSDFHDHHRLDGSRYGYSLIWSGYASEGRWILAVDPREATELDIGLLQDEIASIAFSLGCPFDVSVLHGLDELGNPAGLLGSHLGVRHAPRPRVAAPVPEGWSAPFFNALSARFAALDAGQKHTLRRAIGHFLDALSDAAPGGFEVKTLLASIAAARLVLGEGAALVASGARWSAWITQNQGAIEELAEDGLADELLTAARGCGRPGEASMIRMALLKAGLEPTEEIGKAIDSVVGELRGEQADEPSSSARGACLRTILVALIARQIGYAGPIRGWERPASSRSYLPADRSWWKVNARDAPKPFVEDVSEEDAQRAVFGLWPAFDLPLSPVPREGPIALIALFADALESNTRGLVAASVLPFADSSVKAAGFDFVLRATSRPTASTVLFSMEGTANGPIKITGWADDDLVLSTDAEAHAFLDVVARAEETRREVQQLMLAAWPVQR